MKPKNILRLAFELAVSAVFAFVVALPAAAQDSDHDRNHWKECSVKTLHSRFGFFAQGTLFKSDSGATLTPPVPFVSSGVFTCDGEGNVSGSYNLNVGGGLILTGQTIAGTYVVNPDCTYSATLPGGLGLPLDRAGTITGEGMNQEIHIIYTNPDGSVFAYGTLKRTPEWCSLKTLKGNYALFGDGLIFVSATAIIPRATAGLLTFDGEGNFEGAATGNTNGGITQGGFKGTYTVTDDCEVSAEIDVTSGPNIGVVIHEVGSVTGERESREIHDIFTTVTSPSGSPQHWVFTDTLKKQ